MKVFIHGAGKEIDTTESEDDTRSDDNSVADRNVHDHDSVSVLSNGCNFLHEHRGNWVQN